MTMIYIETLTCKPVQTAKLRGAVRWITSARVCVPVFSRRRYGKAMPCGFRTSSQHRRSKEKARDNEEAWLQIL